MYKFFVSLLFVMAALCGSVSTKAFAEDGQVFAPAVLSPNSSTVVTAGGQWDLFVSFSFAGATNPEGVFNVNFGIHALDGSGYTQGMFDGSIFAEQPYTWAYVSEDVPAGYYVLIAYVADGYEGNPPYIQTTSDVFEVVAQPYINAVTPEQIGIGNSVSVYGGSFRPINRVVINRADDLNVSAVIDPVPSWSGDSFSFDFPRFMTRYNGKENRGELYWVEPGVYKIQIQNDVGGQVTRYVSVVYPQINIFESFDKQTHHAGEVLNFSYYGEGLNTFTEFILVEAFDERLSWEATTDYVYQLDGVGSSSLFLPWNIRAGQYYLELRSSGAVASSSLFTVVGPTPTISQLQAAVTTADFNYTAYVGQGATFTCFATGASGSYSYSWDGFDVSKTGDGQAYVGAFTVPGLRSVTCTVVSNEKGGGEVVTISQKVLVLASDGGKESPAGLLLYQKGDGVGSLVGSGVNILPADQKKLEKAYSLALKRAAKKNPPKGVLAGDTKTTK